MICCAPVATRKYEQRLRAEAADLSNHVGGFRTGAGAQANPVHQARERVAAFARPGR